VTLLALAALSTRRTVTTLSLPRYYTRLKVYPHPPYRPSHETSLNHPATTREQARGETVGNCITADDCRDCIELPISATSRNKNARSKNARSKNVKNENPGTKGFISKNGRSKNPPGIERWGIRTLDTGNEDLGTEHPGRKLSASGTPYRRGPCSL
jgi:hypothetical protein